MLLGVGSAFADGDAWYWKFFNNLTEKKYDIPIEDCIEESREGILVSEYDNSNGDVRKQTLYTAFYINIDRMYQLIITYDGIRPKTINCKSSLPDKVINLQ